MRRLLIFVKEPIPGQVKTRLAAEVGLRLRRSALPSATPARLASPNEAAGVPASVGADAACRVYRRCVERTLERLSGLRDEITLCLEPADATARIRTWLGPAWALRPQYGATLGERLAEATGSAFAEGGRRILVIGTDSPWLDQAVVEQAFSRLAHADLVLGPATDGGYYLTGLGRPAPGLFHGIAWSSSRVLAQTLAHARALGLTVSLLPEGYDIDRLTDLQRWMREDPHHGITIHTRRMAHV